MKYNLNIKKGTFESTLSSLNKEHGVKVLQSLEFINVLSIETDEKKMNLLLKKYPAIIDAEDDGSVHAIDE